MKSSHGIGIRIKVWGLLVQLEIASDKSLL